MAGLAPSIEIPYHADLLGIWRPQGEICSLCFIHGHGMGSQLLIEADMGAFVEEIEILIGQEGHVREDRMLGGHCHEILFVN